jgi:3-hydroxy-9,10-secoandrosta-1,3,5(10)-triene-9,17-dione monooxygenase reductase component
MTTSLVVQLSSAPKLIGAAVETDSLTLRLIRGGRGFALSLLSRDARAIVRSFVKPAAFDPVAKTLSGETYVDAPVTGSPVLASARAYLDCTLYAEQELGSHALVIGEVVDAHLTDGDSDRGRFEVLRMEDTRMSYGG